MSATRSELYRILEGVKSEIQHFRATARSEFDEISPVIVISDEIGGQISELQETLDALL